ncbi:MAG: hypothetical protein K2Z81_13430 [Cyanobacteria bacterium]|nr:hypothetical protein [Cyanobacteriota bacterium]
MDSTERSSAAESKYIDEGTGNLQREVYVAGNLHLAGIIENKFGEWDTDGDDFLNRAELKTAKTAPEFTTDEHLAAELALLHFDDIRTLASTKGDLRGSMLGNDDANAYKNRITEDIDVRIDHRRKASNKISKDDIEALIAAHDNKGASDAFGNIAWWESAILPGSPKKTLQEEVQRIRKVVNSWDKNSR